MFWYDAEPEKLNGYCGEPERLRKGEKLKPVAFEFEGTDEFPVEEPGMLKDGEKLKPIGLRFVEGRDEFRVSKFRLGWRGL